jgi:hypothetical protein
MEVGQGPNWGCSANGKKDIILRTEKDMWTRSSPYPYPSNCYSSGEQNQELSQYEKGD